MNEYEHFKKWVNSFGEKIYYKIKPLTKKELYEIAIKQEEEIERLNKCIDEALEIIIKDWNDKCTIPIHSVVDTGDDIRIKLYYQLFFKGVDKE